MPTKPKTHGQLMRITAPVATHQERESAAKRGYDRRWRAYRLTYLREHPLCVECEKQGETVAATIVDHVIPHRGDAFLFWEPSNHAAMCKPCHDRKTAKDDGGFGNARG